MEFNIWTPFFYVMLALFFDVTNSGTTYKAFYLLIFGPFIANIYIYIWEKGIDFDNITQDEVKSFFFSSVITMMSAIIVFFIYRFIKKGNNK